MSETPYRAMGGCVVSDHGVLALADARGLAGFYALEAASPETGGRWRRLAAQRSRVLTRAAEDAGRWRRAAGWSDPDVADQS